MNTEPKAWRLAALKRQRDSVKRQIIEAEYGDDSCYVTGKMLKLNQEWNVLNYTISALEAEGTES